MSLLLDNGYREDQIAGANIVYHVETLHHAAETGVNAVEMLRILAVMADEELRTAGIPAAMRHRQHAAVVILALGRGLALNGVTRSSRAVAARTAALNHEIGYDAVKRQSVIKMALGQLYEVGYRAGRLLFIEFGAHVALLGGNYGIFHILAIIVIDSKGNNNCAKTNCRGRIRCRQLHARLASAAAAPGSGVGGSALPSMSFRTVISSLS